MITKYLRDRIHAKLIDEEEFVQEEKMSENQTLPGHDQNGNLVDAIRCSYCGELVDSMDTRWSLGQSGQWFHSCGEPQAGRFESYNFGKLMLSKEFIEKAGAAEDACGGFPNLSIVPSSNPIEFSDGEMQILQEMLIKRNNKYSMCPQYPDDFKIIASIVSDWMNKIVSLRSTPVTPMVNSEIELLKMKIAKLGDRIDSVEGQIDSIDASIDYIEANCRR